MVTYWLPTFTSVSPICSTDFVVSQLITGTLIVSTATWRVPVTTSIVSVTSDTIGRVRARSSPASADADKDTSPPAAILISPSASMRPAPDILIVPVVRVLASIADSSTKRLAEVFTPDCSVILPFELTEPVIVNRDPVFNNKLPVALITDTEPATDIFGATRWTNSPPWTIAGVFSGETEEVAAERLIDSRALI